MATRRRQYSKFYPARFSFQPTDTSPAPSATPQETLALPVNKGSQASSQDDASSSDTTSASDLGGLLKTPLQTQKSSTSLSSQDSARRRKYATRFPTSWMTPNTSGANTPSTDQREKEFGGFDVQTSMTLPQLHSTTSGQNSNGNYTDIMSERHSRRAGIGSLPRHDANGSDHGPTSASYHGAKEMTAPAATYSYQAHEPAGFRDCGAYSNPNSTDSTVYPHPTHATFPKRSMREYQPYHQILRGSSVSSETHSSASSTSALFQPMQQVSYSSYPVYDAPVGPQTTTHTSTRSDGAYSTNTSPYDQALAARSNVTGTGT